MLVIIISYQSIITLLFLFIFVIIYVFIIIIVFVIIINHHRHLYEPRSKVVLQLGSEWRISGVVSREPLWVSHFARLWQWMSFCPVSERCSWISTGICRSRVMSTLVNYRAMSSVRGVLLSKWYCVWRPFR